MDRMLENVKKHRQVVVPPDSFLFVNYCVIFEFISQVVLGEKELISRHIRKHNWIQFKGNCAVHLPNSL